MQKILKLKQVDPSDYAALVTAAESIGTPGNTPDFNSGESGSVVTGEEAPDE